MYILSWVAPFKFVGDKMKTISKNVSPVAKLDSWELYLLGFVNENIRKAILFNSLTKEELPAKVTISKDQKTTSYTVIEAVDEKKNTLVEFTKVFKVTTR